MDVIIARVIVRVKVRFALVLVLSILLFGIVDEDCRGVPEAREIRTGWAGVPMSFPAEGVLVFEEKDVGGAVV